MAYERMDEATQSREESRNQRSIFACCCHYCRRSSSQTDEIMILPHDNLEPDPLMIDPSGSAAASLIKQQGEEEPSSCFARIFCCRKRATPNVSDHSQATTTNSEQSSGDDDNDDNDEAEEDDCIESSSSVFSPMLDDETGHSHSPIGVGYRPPHVLEQEHRLWCRWGADDNTQDNGTNERLRPSLVNKITRGGLRFKGSGAANEVKRKTTDKASVLQLDDFGDDDLANVLK